MMVMFPTGTRGGFKASDHARKAARTDEKTAYTNVLTPVTGVGSFWH